MDIPPSSFEKRSFFIFIFLILFSSFLFILKNNNEFPLALSAFLLGMFGIFRFIYLMNEKIKNIPSFLTLPAKILFGLNEAESHYKKQIIKKISSKYVMIWVTLSFCFLAWGLFCSFHIINSEEIKLIFQKEFPVIRSFSYLNGYNILVSLLSFIMTGLIVLISVTYYQFIYRLKKIYFSLFLIFILLFVFLFLNSSFTFSAPPLYTALMKGIGWGKADLIFAYQPQTTIYPATPLFKRYIEMGLIGCFLLYGVMIPIIFSLLGTALKNIHDSLYMMVSLFCLLVFLVIDCLIISPFLSDSLKILGFVLIGLGWGLSLKEKNP